MGREEAGEGGYGYVQRVLIAAVVSAAVVVVLLFVWRTLGVLLLIFSGILFGILLRWCRDKVARWLRVPKVAALVVVVLSFLLLVGGGITLLAPLIREQFVSMGEELPKAWRDLTEYLRQYSFGKELLQEAQQPEEFLSFGAEGEGEFLNNLAGIFSTTVGALISCLIVLILGIYVAGEPLLYRDGLLRLFPKHRRPRIREVMVQLGITLRWWMLGQGVSMLVLGTVTTVGLWLLDVPLALVMGLLAAVMTFIPNLGPFIAAVPALLLALAQGPMTAVYVGLLYLVIQNVEGYFITPMIHRKIIAMPPFLIISTQVLLATLVGFVGVLLAMPLLTSALVLVRMLYVEDALGDKLDEPALGTEDS